MTANQDIAHTALGKARTLRMGALVSLAVVLAGCGDDDPAVRAAAAPVAATVEVVSVAGGAPPANPLSNAATPPELNRTFAIAYQGQGVSDARITKVLVMMPGFLAGANTFDYLARRVVARSGGATAVWVNDRRSNAQEDLAGMDAAEAARDPDIAKGYYFRGATVNGRTFAGLRPAAELSFESEWGIKTHVEDLDALITTARGRYPNAAIFLGGHSLGAAIAPVYAAWDFGAYAGFERLSGLVLLDGAPAAGSATATPTQEDYESKGIGSSGQKTSLKRIRSGSGPIATLPFISSDLFLSAEIVAMRASTLLGNPHAESPDADLVKGFLGLLLGLPEVPPATTAAVFGLGFDNDYQPLSIVRVSIGEAIGPLRPNPNLEFLPGLVQPDEMLLAPSDPTAHYDWRQPADQAVPDPTDMETFARVVFQGPSNLIEWYFPARLAFDTGVASRLDVARAGDWRKDVYGMAATENSRVDVPVYAVGAGRGVAPTTEPFERYRQSISPTLRNGAPRASTPHGFEASVRDGYVHIDVVTARDEGAGEGEFGPLAEWMNRAAELAPRRK